ncbi:potassium channel family protein [Alkalicoccobacillus plakortidis]|uniref:TrkA family potassium uptake protein n=1 Tax=Alkalicoccobacillus plakortidis TaxID=444060 RepID=A0ABT0XND7_9BACI|nr:TrkA family potassium uptake protein [Alkalicoccobacillus plakortidis]MCM2677418.1 TrkA family potassium uptake protein [Alkalicoccobacillus plakortidis]
MAKETKKQVAVIGLGRFGGSVCKELYKTGYEVLAIDRNTEKINQYVDFSTHAIQMDTTDEEALSNAGIKNCSHVVVAIGNDIQSSILTTLILKELDIPNVWTKAQNQYHHKVLERIGADRIIHPEYDMGIRVAQNMVAEKIIDYIDLSDDYSIAELFATPIVNGKTLASLDLRRKYKINVLAIKRDNRLTVSPMPEDTIQTNDLLIIIGLKKDVKRFQEKGL